MKIALVSSKSSELEVTARVAKILTESIKGVEVVSKSADTNLDIPKIISSLKGFSLVVVALYYAKETADVKVVMEKLVDLDLKGSATLKFISPSEEADEKAESKKIADAVLDKLFGKVSKKSSSSGFRSFTEI